MAHGCKTSRIGAQAAQPAISDRLEKRYQITVHTTSGPVRFYKDENGLPLIDLEESSEEGAVLLVQIGDFPHLANSPKLSSYQVLGQSRKQQRHPTRSNHPRIDAQ
jgi:hypothetical protein